MASPLRSSNSGSGTSPVSPTHGPPHQNKTNDICRVKLIPLGEKDFDSEVTDITAAHMQDLQCKGSPTNRQSHLDEDSRVHPINRTPVDTPTTTVVSLAHNDYQEVSFTPSIEEKIRDLHNDIRSLETTLKGWQVASKVEEALYEYLCQFVLPPDQLARMKSPSADLFFYSVNRCEHRHQRGLSILPSDATDFHIWNTYLKTRWEDIIKAVNAKREYWGTLHKAHPPTGAVDYDSFVTSLQLPLGQQALLARARSDILSFMCEA